MDDAIKRLKPDLLVKEKRESERSVMFALLKMANLYYHSLTVREIYANISLTYVKQKLVLLHQIHFISFINVSFLKR